MRALLLALVAAPSLAQAGTVPLWSAATWPSPPEGEDVSPVAGTNGWVGGYEEDPWSGTRSGQFLVPVTDDNNGFPTQGGFGDGGPTDNWLIRGEAFRDGGIRSDLGNYDDDALGLVLSNDGEGSFYLLFHTSDASPPPIDGPARGNSLVLVRIQDGDVTVLQRDNQVTDVSAEDAVEMRFNRDGDRLTGFFGGKLVLNVIDPEPLAPGRAGVWAYDCGIEAGTTCWFDTLNVYRLDADDDTIADDDDNCETVANEDQRDADDDGTGDACDADPGDTDAPVDTDTVVDTDPGDTDANTETGGPRPPEPGENVDEDLIASCNCATGGASAGAWIALAGLALARRRRR